MVEYVYFRLIFILYMENVSCLSFCLVVCFAVRIVNPPGLTPYPMQGCNALPDKVRTQSHTKRLYNNRVET